MCIYLSIQISEVIYFIAVVYACRSCVHGHWKINLKMHKDQRTLDQMSFKF